LFAPANHDTRGHAFCPPCILPARGRLVDFIHITPGAPKRQTPFNRIAAKHVDFLLCEPATMKPVLALELDDSSHARRGRRTRDDFLQDTCQAIALPLLRFPTAATYEPASIKAAIDHATA